MDLDLSARARADPRHGARVRARARRAAVAEELDRESRFPYELVEEMAELGLMGIPVPEEYGGSGGDTRLLRDRDRGADPGRLVGGDHGRRAHLARDDADPHVRERGAEARVAAGARLGQPAGGAFGLTEPGAGSDSAGTQTRAEKVPEGLQGGQRRQDLHHQRQRGEVHHLHGAHRFRIRARKGRSAR